MKKMKNMIFILMLLMLLSACGEPSREAEQILLSGEGEEAKPQGNQENATQEEAQDPSLIYVQVCGAVKRPGVYELPQGSRVFQALELAGGVTQEADAGSLNQAECVTDGQMIQVLTAEQAAAQEEKQAEAQPEDDGKVNLNTAAKEELMTLAGIGEAKAESILSWRKEHGSFAQIEDLMKIEGIKEGVFSKIKDYVKVQ